ncbi:MAG TPA: hypothetical protein DFR83_16135 [Deltaproteobacteria bacterium]|nr:hypothetical protein [Deltaproteobacteria bacterium]
MLAAGVLCACGGNTTSPLTGEPLPDVAIIVVDTLRADAVVRAETPGIDDIAQKGIRVPFAWSPSTWTAPSTLSLMTGTHVRDHGWDLPFPRFMAQAGLSYPSVDDRTTLAEVLTTHGYRTIGLFANPLLSRNLGWERGYGDWQQEHDSSMARTLRRSVRYMKQFDPNRPLMVYLHLLGPHQPIRPSRQAARRWGVRSETRHLSRKGIRIEHAVAGRRDNQDQYVRAYHAQVEDTDSKVGELVQVMKRRGRPLLVVLTSDHGELLGEHDSWGHETSVWNALTHVPLIVSGDGLIPIPEVMTTAAIPDYITKAVGIPHQWPVSIDDQPVLVSQRDGAVAVSGDGRYRGIWDTDGATLTGVYDIVMDPDEAMAIPDFAPRAVLQMHRSHWLAETPNNVRDALDEALDDETRSLLEELGYMGHTEADDATDPVEAVPE